MKTWFDIKAAARGEKKSEVSIFGEIGDWGVSAADFASQLSAIPEDHAITVRINSQGGSVTEGYAIYNALKRRANVTTVVEGLAASMASVIMLAGSKIQANANSLIVIHNPLLMGATGNAEELRKLAADIEKIGMQITGIYVAATGKSEADVKAAMDAETMFTAEEAKAWGLVQEVIQDSEADGPKNTIAPMLVKMKAQISAGASAVAAITAERDEIKAKIETMETQAAHSSEQIAALKVESDQRAEALDSEKAAHALTKAQRDESRAELLRRDAESAVGSAIASNRLAETARAEFIALFIADAAKAKTILAALPVVRGNAPVPPESNDESASDAAILAEYRTLKGKTRDAFFSKHTDAIWRAASAS